MLIKRHIFEELKAHLAQKEITLLTGPRQAGKTTLLNLLSENLQREGGKTVSFNLDIETDSRSFESQEALLRKIALELGTAGGYVFIDEIQRTENARLFLKGLYDMNLPYKFIVSGSGSLELMEKIHESLMGRKRIFELSTLTFVEFADHKTQYKYHDDLPEFMEVEKPKARGLLEEYMAFGGYPRIALEETANEKRRLIGELYQSYLERDMAHLLGVQKTDRFTALARLMSSQIGQMAIVSEIANTLGINTTTVNHYLWYMEKTFILHKVTPYFRNVRKELTKTPVYYYHDLGLRNYALGSYGNPLPPSESGFLFQNFIHNVIRDRLSNTPHQLHHWRTTDKAEVDFVVNKNREVIPVEVKYKALKSPETGRSFQNFISAYKPSRGYIVHLGDTLRTTVNSTEVVLINWAEFLFENLAD